jgi:organic hydroperoxide reductase OsmC/OhrA
VTLARRFEYSATVDADGPMTVEDDWTPEHLLLAGLGRCTLKSLRFHAEQRDIEARGSATCDGLVTKREEDGRYALVETQCGLDVELDPAPSGEDLSALIDLAERDCFVGASLVAQPRYEWRVNGEVFPR